jgi:hypothetical protein
MAVLVAFADSRLHHTLKRIRRQAKKFQEFESILTLNENDLDSSFVEEFEEKLKPTVKGFGFWSWKPQVILQALRGVDAGQIVVYVDAGCHLNVAGASRLKEYFDIVSNSQSGILGFELKFSDGVLPESAWTKGDVFDFFGVRDNAVVTEAAQICGTIVILQKRPETVAFIERWLEIFKSNFRLVDDSPSAAPNLPGFLENRADQSVFSVMAKLSNISLLSHSENFPELEKRPGKRDWHSLKQYPIHAKRDKNSLTSKLKSKFTRLLRRITRS